MIKSVTSGLCLLALTGTLAFAQSGQGPAAGNTGPIAQNTGTNPIDANAKRKKKKMKKGMMKPGMSGDNMSKDGMSGGMMKKDGMSK